MNKVQFPKKRTRRKEDIPNIDSFLINYNWISQKNNVFRGLPPDFIIKHVLKIDYPNFDTLREWINDEKIDPMGGSLGKVNRKKLKNKKYTKKIKNEDSVRFIGDFSPTVEFKSDQFNRSIKLSRHILLNNLRNDISSKFDEMFGSDIQVKGGLHQISLYLDTALNDLMHNVGERKLHEIHVISFLNLYKMKNEINPHEQNYGIIRGLMQDVMSIESNFNRFRGGLNVFHLMTLLGWESAFKFEGLCLFFETITNDLVVGVKSFIERLWRFTHDFSTVYSIKRDIESEFREKAYSEDWITSLEELYSSVELIDLNYNFEKFNENFPSINLNFDYNNGETLLLLNKLRNTYVHSSPWSVLGAEKEELVTQKRSELQSYTIYNLYIAYSQLIKNVECNGFSDFLSTKGINTQNLDLNNPLTHTEILKCRIEWRAPTVLRNRLSNIASPGLLEDFPKETILGVELPEINKFYLYPRKIIKCETKAIKEISNQTIRKISLFNLSDSLDSLFSFIKNLLKVFILNEIVIEN